MNLDFTRGDVIKVAGAGKHSNGTVTEGTVVLREGLRFVRYRCDYSGGERLAPIAKVQLVKKAAA
jgi:hypothetical protein